MALTNLHPSNMTWDQFIVVLKDFLTQFEGCRSAPYFDTNRSAKPTIGIGFNLGVTKVRDEVFAAMKLTATQQTAAIKVLNDHTITTDADLQSKLKTAIGRDFLMTDTEITEVFKLEAGERTTSVSTSSGVGYSYELAALVSLQYSAVYGPNLKRILTGTVDAAQIRADAWYDIRYGSNSDGAHAKRRYAEAAMFGLYNDNVNVTVPDAKAVYRMFTLHRSDVVQYESQYGSAYIGAANADLAVANLGNVAAQDIKQALNPAKMTILADLGGNANTDIVNAYQAWIALGNDPVSFDSTNLYLDPGRNSATDSIMLDPLAHVAILDARQYETANGSNDILIGEGRADGAGGDILYGGKGNDLLIGGDGNDSLYGGDGKDVLAGGGGDDKYYVTRGEEVTIEDKQGINTILLDGREIGSFYKLPDGTNYVSYDGGLTAVLQNGDFIITDKNGTKVTLNKNFTEGDFGISFKDADVALQSDYTAVGDPLIHTANIAPGGQGTDWRITKSYNQQYGTDANGNSVLVSYDVDYFLVDTNGNPTEVGTASRADTLNGTAANDHLMSGGGDDIINAATGGGNDILDGGAGRDDIKAGAGNDILIGGADGDILQGGLGNDRIYGTSETTTAQAIASGNAGAGSGQQGDWLNGNSGDDTLIGSTGNDVLMGGAGNDDICGDTDWQTNSMNWTVTDQPLFRLFDPATGTSSPADAAADTIYAGSGDDHVWGGAGDDIVYGEDGNDKLSGNANNDIIFGGAGDDTINGDGIEHYGETVVNEGNDFIDSGDGNDTVYGNGGSDTLLGGAGDDKLSGDNGDGTGNEGNDIIDGGDGNDKVWGNGGNDTLLGGAGNDTISGDNGDGSGAEGNDTIDGGDGSDQIFGNGGNDVLLGGAGNDTIMGDSGTASAAQGDDYIDGGDGNDIINGEDGNNTLFGGAGDDQIFAGNGVNYLDGEDGNDTLSTTGSGSTLFGGAGDDNLQATGGNSYLDGEDGNNTLYAEGGNNELFAGAGNDSLAAKGGNNYLEGGDGNNTLVTNGLGGNTLLGGTGDDTLSAEGGNNYLDSGDGTNTLIANGGNNTLIAGTGNDYFSAAGGNSYLDGGDEVVAIFGNSLRENGEAANDVEGRLRA
jgi:Ca2+-binding RTX toxin-like protein